MRSPPRRTASRPRTRCSARLRVGGVLAAARRLSLHALLARQCCQTQTLRVVCYLSRALTHWRSNYLLPEGLAKLADESILAAIKAKREAEEAAARKVLDEAKALATALSTIGKFTVKVKVGEDKRIFGRRVSAP